MAAEVPPQVALFLAVEPAQVAFAMSGHAFVESVQDGPLFFLHQKQNFHRFPCGTERLDKHPEAEPVRPVSMVIGPQ
ncbi:hypothetical protein D3C75_1103190 [compost metagenome]